MLEQNMNSEMWKGLVAVLALVAIICVLSYLFLKVVKMILQYRSEKDDAHLTMLLSLAEQGHTIPSELLVSHSRNNVKSDLRRGLVLVCTGVGLSLFLLSVSGGTAWGLGLVPVFTGIGFLLSAKFAQKDE